MKLLLPLILAFAGLASGLAAGAFLRAEAPPPDAGAAHGGARQDGHGDDAARRPSRDPPEATPPADLDYVKLNRQFIVPLIEEETVTALMIMSLSLEIDPGFADEVFRREPKLRDAFLKVLFRHARSGTLGRVFSADPALRDLHGALREAAGGVMGADVVHEVLITEMIRQDM